MYPRNPGGGRATGAGSGRKFYLNDLDTTLDSTPSVPRRTTVGDVLSSDQIRHPRLLATPSSESSASKQQSVGTSQREFTPLLRTVVKPGIENGHENLRANYAAFEKPQKPDPLLFDQYQDSVSLESFDRSNKSGLYSAREKHGIESVLQANNQGKGKLLGESSIPLKEQEEIINYQKNLIFDLQLRINILEQSTPENVQEVAMQNVDLKREISKYKAELSSFEDRLDQMERERLAHANNSGSESRLLLKTQEISELNDKLEEFEEEIRKFKDTIDDKDVRIDELERERLDLLNELNSKDDNKDMSTVSEVKQKYEDELEELRNEVEGLEYENSKLLKFKESLEDDNEKLREELEEGEKSDKDHEHERMELHNLRKANRELEQDFLNLQRLNQQLESDAREKSNKLETFHEEMTSARNEILKNTSEIDHLKSLLQEKNDEKYKVEEQIHSDTRLLKMDLASKSSKISTLENERDALRKELLNLKDQYSSVTGELEPMKILMTRNIENSENYKKERDYFEKKAQEAQVIIEKLNQQVNESIKDKTYIEDMIEIKNEIKRKDQELDRKSNQWAEEKKYLEGKIRNLERIGSSYEDQQANLLKDKSSIQDAITIEKSKHEQEKKSLKLEIDQLHSTITDLKSDIHKLEEKEKLHKSLETELQEKEDDIMSSQHQLIAMQDLKNETENKLNQLRITHSTLENTLSALREVNDNERQNRLRYESDLRESKAELLKLVEEKETLEVSKESVENKLEILEIKYEKLKTRFDAINDTCSKLKSKLANSRYDISQSFIQQSASTNTKYIQKCKDYAKEIQRLRANEQATQSQLERYKNYVMKLKEKWNATLNQSNNNNNQTLISSPQLKIHQQEIKGMLVQMKYLKEAVIRESRYRSDLEFMKQFFMLQIASYQACNRADLAILQTMGIYPDYDHSIRGRPKLKSLAFFVIATIRIRKRYEERDSQLQKKAQLTDIRKEWRKNRSESARDS